MDYERLVARHKNAVFAQMVRVCGNHDDAEDALAEALLAAYRFSERLRDEDAFRGWLATIGRRVCGRIKSRQSLEPVIELADTWLPTAPGPDTLWEAAEIKACVQSAYEALPEAYREVYRLRELEQRPAEEVARRLGLTVANVKSRLHRARTIVRARLEESVCGPV